MAPVVGWQKQAPAANQVFNDYLRSRDGRLFFEDLDLTQLVVGDRPEDTANQMEKWIANLHRLAKRLDAYRRDSLLQNQRELVPQEIKDLTTRRNAEDNPQPSTPIG